MMISYTGNTSGSRRKSVTSDTLAAPMQRERLSNDYIHAEHLFREELNRVSLPNFIYNAVIEAL